VPLCAFASQVVHSHAMGDYSGKTVWITGASSGIGEALAYAFGQRGARLILSARRTERLTQVAKSCGARETHVVPLDLGALETLPAIVERVLTQIGSVDIMVHNAGVGQRSLVLDTAFEVDRRMMEINYLGPVALTKALLPSMLRQKRGQFVVLSSVLGVMSAQRRSGYCASKHALHGYFNGLRAELGRDGVAVLMVCPGRVHTEFSEQAFEGDGSRHGVTDASSQKGLSAGEVAHRMLRALERGEDEVLVAKWESLAVYLNRWAPSLMRRAIARINMR
jgi:dehydrogenase/reductase SDR family protein 7B